MRQCLHVLAANAAIAAYGEASFEAIGWTIQASSVGHMAQFFWLKIGHHEVVVRVLAANVAIAACEEA